MHRPSSVDVALALLFLTGALLEAFVAGLPGPTGAKLLLAVFTAVPLAWRTVAPVATVAVVSGAYVLAVTLGVPADEPLVPVVAPVLATYSLGAHASTRAMAVGGAVAVVAYSLAGGLDAGAEAADIALPIGAVLGSLAVGRAVREMGFESDVLTARAAAAERERDEERARIARELHDVIGHSISVMGVQAGAVRRRLAPEQERERDALVAVERVGRDAVDEMQRLLGLLRADGDDPGPSTPLTRERIDDLVEQMRGAGLDVELRVDGRLDDLAAGRGLAAFRILQEALTNVLRHAPGARVTASVERGAGDLRIAVANEPGSGPGAGGGSGQGLVGMRERASLYGGTLDAGPRPDGGFTVVASLPIGNR
jgi:signal transduction histidine kinase